MSTLDTEQKTGLVPSKPNAVTPAVAGDGVAAAVQNLDPFAKIKNRPKRTTGLWLVDTLIYPIINNIGVFVISVFATYLTEHGWPKPVGKPLGKWREKIGNAFRARGEELDRFLEHKLDMSSKAAGMSRMVFFSFADGTFVAPLVKVLEDRREQMAMGIDTFLGTKPKDESVYEAEPKQSWGSVIQGRLLTSAIVVPVAVGLSQPLAKGKSINDILFNDLGKSIGKHIETERPKINKLLRKVFGEIDMPYFFKTNIFEAFYTSVCTAGLYFISRGVARRHPPKEKVAHSDVNPAVAPAGAASQEMAEAPATEKDVKQSRTDTADTPANSVMQAAHIERLVNTPRTAELTA